MEKCYLGLIINEVKNFRILQK